MPKDDKKKDKSSQVGRIAGKMFVDASKLVFKTAADEVEKKVSFSRPVEDEEKPYPSRKAREMLRDVIKSDERVVVAPPERPDGVTTRKWRRESKPTRTFVQGSRTVEVVKKRSLDPTSPEFSLNPGIDGLVSFSVLMFPAAVVSGAILILVALFLRSGGWTGLPLTTVLTTVILFLILPGMGLYTLFIAIPGAYLGIDAMYYGSKQVVMGGATTVKVLGLGIIEMCRLFLLGLYEVAMIFVDGLFGFARGAFESLEDYWAFTSVYAIFTIAFSAVIIIIVMAVGLEFMFQVPGIFILGFLILIMGFFPALFPASIAHRAWKQRQWRIQREKLLAET